MPNPIEQVAGLFQGQKPNGFPLTREQAEALIESTQERKMLRAMLYLVFSIGLTQQEMLKIEVRDIDFQQGAISLKEPRRILKLPEKTLIALSEAIASKRDNDVKLFVYSDRTIDNSIKDLGIGSLGFPLTWSSLRKTWAVLCFQRGVSVTSMVRYSGSSIEALAKWAVIGRPGLELPLELI